PASERLPDEAARRRGAGGRRRQPDAEGRDQRSDPRLGDECADDVLPARVGRRAAPVSRDGARVPVGHRTRGARAASRTRREVPRCRRRLRRRWLEAAVANGGHHPRARARARDRGPHSHPRRARARDRRPRLSLGARRQGPRHGHGASRLMATLTVDGKVRLERAFAKARAERRLAVVVYLTVGYPDRDATAPLLRAALDGGTDIVELGVPFSDPLADGSTVQRASETALRNGVTLDDCIREGADLVRERDAAVQLMGYTNPFYRRGYERLASDLATPTHVAALRGVADGVAVGSAVLDVIGRAAVPDRATALRDFVRSLVEAGRS